jgi:hypothetical protein
MKQQYRPKEKNIEKLKEFYLSITNESKKNNKDISTLPKK